MLTALTILTLTMLAELPLAIAYAAQWHGDHPMPKHGARNRTR